MPIATPVFATPPAAPLFPSPPPASTDPPPPGESLFAEPWLSPDQELPSCDVYDLAESCPTLTEVARNPNLPCGLDQVGEHCAYPSDARGANLLECALAPDGASWQRRHARCARNCWEEMPHSFAELSDANCSERELVDCERAATDQDAVDDELKRIRDACGLPDHMAIGTLLSPQGCARAVFIEDTGSLAKCAANRLARVRFGCVPRCASSKEADDILL
jgi:hypothetical protein